MKNDKWEANIWKLYLVKAARSFMLVIPIITLFFKENGLSMKDIFLLQSLFSLTVILLEIPTGYFSDIFGRKRSIVIGGIFASLGYTIYSLSYSFGGFLLAEIILGFGLSFVSGADSAMLYDTLLEIKKDGEYQKVEGRGLGIGVASEGIASILGGFLALVSLRFPFYWDTAFTFLIVPIALSLVETKKHKEAPVNVYPGSIFKLMKHCLHDNASIKWLIIYSAFVNASTLTMFWFTQPYLVATNVPLAFFGIVSAALFFVAAAFSWNAHRLEKILGRKLSLTALAILPAAGFLLLSLFRHIWSGIFILLFYIARGINNPVTLDYINSHIPSDVRATVLSIRNLFGRLVFSATGPFLGWVNDAYSLQAALLASAATFLAGGMTAFLFMRKNKIL